MALINYLKGEIVAYARANGMKHESKREPDGEFKAGLEAFEEKRWVSEDWVTLRHILHNRIRHNRPHTGTRESDQVFLDYHGLAKEELLNEIQNALDAWGDDTVRLVSEFYLQ